MPTASSSSPKPLTTDNPASTPRSKIRGFTYLRSHTQSSTPTLTSSNITQTSSRSRRSRLIRSISSPAGPLLDPLSRAISPSPPSSNRVPVFGDSGQNQYNSGSEQALHAASLELPLEDHSEGMARNRAGTAPNGAHRTSESASSSLTGHPQDQMPTIRLLPHQDPRSTRPSLAFPATSRTLPHEDCVIRVGRYSERDINPNPPPHTPSSAPVGFKSKVVSRRHCEFWCSQGQWYIKDVKSSSGTFLNHIRLSQPSAESKPFPVHDGDVVQLGIDFRGGEEMIFRCVKIRVECNRAWQKTINNYNVKTHKQLRDLGKTATKKDSDATSSHSSECSICLMSIAPCQSLFVAPCSHVWHYKCIRPILNDHKSWPQFLCPNCRAVTDLEADIEDPEDGNWEDGNGTESSPEMAPIHDTNDMVPEHEEIEMGGEDDGLSNSTSRLLSVRDDSRMTPSVTTSSDPTNGANTAPGLLNRRGARRISPPFPHAGDQSASKSATGSMNLLRPITPTRPLLGTEDFNESALRTPTTDMLIHDGPMTPTNNAGPFVFDGSAGRRVDNEPSGRADNMSSNT